MEFYYSGDHTLGTGEVIGASCESTPYPSKSEMVGFTSGRCSPGHDLGYHTLLTRPSLSPVPPQTVTGVHRSFDIGQTRLSSPSPWRNIVSPFPHIMDTSALSSCPSAASPRSLPSTNRNAAALSDTEKLLATFKGKRVPKSSPFDKISDELILKIFFFLSSNQLCLCARVCRRWYFLAWEPQLWTSVTLSGEKTHVDRGLKTLFRLLCRDSPSVCLTVERISLNGCLRLTDKGLFTIARRCPELRTLEIRGCGHVSNSGVSELLSRCVNLEKLDITGCFQVTSLFSRHAPASADSGTDPESLPGSSRQLYLQYLDMTDCHQLEDSGLKTIVHNCPQLTHLFLRRCGQLTDAGIKCVTSYCVMLRELSISDCIQVTDFGMYELAKLGPNLRYLSVAKCDQVSDAGIKQIARHCYKLRYLNVRGCEAVSDHSMEVLSRSCPRLRALDIAKCDVTDHGLKLLSEHCPNLKKLSVKSCDMVTDRGIQAIAYYCRGLQQLSIQDCPITVDGYRTVRKYCKRCIIEHTNPGFF